MMGSPYAPLSVLKMPMSNRVNQENLMNFVAVAIVLAIVLATRSTKESTFDWFKSHSPLFR